jgi:hypothetical protein
VLYQFDECWQRWEPITEETARIYQAAWEPLSDDLLMAAAVQVMRSGRDRFPPPGVVFQAALDLFDGEPPAAEAWNRTLRAASDGRPESSLTRRTQAALQAVGGLRALAMSSTDQNAAHRARFLEAYREQAMVRRAEWALTGSVLALESGE